MIPEPNSPVPDMVALIVMHGREWRIVTPDGHHHVMNDKGSVTGPFVSRSAAWEFISKQRSRASLHEGEAQR